MNKFIFLFSLFMICSCQSTELNWGIAKDYFPSADLLTDGIVSKYYIHAQETDDEDIGTHVVYQSALVKGNRLYIKRFRPDFSLTFEKQFEFENNKMVLLEEWRYSINDTIKVAIEIPDVVDWTSNEGDVDAEKTMHYETMDVDYKRKQVENRDTSLQGLPAKIFVDEGIWSRYNSTDTSSVSFNIQNIYVQGLGLFYQKYKDVHVTQWMELVEQIPLSTFNEMASVQRNRVAFIDPSNTLDDNESFQTCNPIHQIYDYYNGQKITYYEGGKKAIWNTVKPLLESEKILNESGYLTFRFVVNCEGEAGRVTTEQSDLDFQRKQFNDITVNHFYEIFQQLSDWISIENRQNEAVDAYYYLTFKLREGELIELLP